MLQLPNSHTCLAVSSLDTEGSWNVLVNVQEAHWAEQTIEMQSPLGNMRSSTPLERPAHLST